MPYEIDKEDCEQSDGDDGTHVLSYTDSKGRKHRNCHTSKEKALGQIAAIEEGSKIMRMTLKQLRQIINESIDVINASTGEIMLFGDEGDASLGNFKPDAPELAARDVIKRLGLTPLENMSYGAREAGVEEIYLSDEDWYEMDHEIGGKRHKRKAKKELARLDIDNLMARLEDWALNAGDEYVADNPDVDKQDIAWDLAKGAEYDFEPDEWNILLYGGPFEGEDDLYTYIADLIA